MEVPSTSALPTTEESNVGEVTNSTNHSKIQESKWKRKNTSFTLAERFEIGEYKAVYGPTAAVRKFKRTHPYLSFGESTARTFRGKYLTQKFKSLTKEITSATQGPKLMLGQMDEEILKYLSIIRRKGRVVTGVIATAVLKR